jgi:hypothetical protein
MDTKTPFHSVNERPRVFISYKRNADPDVPVVERVVQSLNDHCEIYIDREIPIGTEWAKWIKNSIKDSDYFIAFLTASSLQSKMFEEEIRLAHMFKSDQDGKPKILPVKLGNSIDIDHVSYEMGAILKPIQWAEWTDHGDTPGLIDKLLGAMRGKELPLRCTDFSNCQPSSFTQSLIPPPALSGKSLYWREGIVRRDSCFYVERADDHVALEAISQEGGETITIKGSRQMGKSSLLARTMQRAAELGMRKVWIDFKMFEQKRLANANLFYKHFCDMITENLQKEEDLGFLENNVEKHWARDDSNVLLCTRYFSRHILEPLRQTEKDSLVLALDDVDRLAGCDFCSDFFGMLRAWHNERSISSSPLWSKLYILLATSTEPFQFIENLNRSPFNVGLLIELDDFTIEQVAGLNELHGSPFSLSQLNQLMELLGGQPYLVRRALYLVASGKTSAADVFAHATEDHGPFGDYLRYYLRRLHGQQGLIEALRNIIYDGDTTDEPAAYRLRGIGLIRKFGRREEMRCKLYQDFFREHL